MNRWLCKCGNVTTGSSCAVCGLRRTGQRVNPVYRTPQWRNIRSRAVSDHRRRYGDLCPGFRRPPHKPTTPLSADHVEAMGLGGDPFGAVQVLCASCNTRKRWAEMPRRKLGA